MNNAILEIKNIEKSFISSNSSGLFNKKKFVAVNKVSFDVKRGETVGLIGESGCGKTTVGKIITGLVRPDGGEIFVNGENLTKLEKNDIKKYKGKIQMIFQDPNSALNPQMKIGKILREALHSINIKNTGEQSKIIEDYISKVGIQLEHLDRYPHELSGGQKQRICILLALLTNPDFIVADEVVSALDLSVQAQILNLLKLLQKDLKLSILFISHNLDIIYYMSDRIIVMYMGEIVEFGDCEQVYKNSKHPYTQLLLSSVLNLDLKDESNIAEDEDEYKTNVHKLSVENACVFANRCPYKREKCECEKPKDIKLGENHVVKCHFPLEK